MTTDALVIVAASIAGLFGVGMVSVIGIVVWCFLCIAHEIAVSSIKQVWRSRHPWYVHRLHNGGRCYHKRYEDIFLCERCESENLKVLRGDSRAIYGNYPPAEGLG